MGGGLLTSVFLFLIGHQLAGRAGVAFAAAVLHTANLSQLFFEANLVTEAATTTMLVATVWSFLHMLSASGTGRSVTPAVLLCGVLAGMTALARPGLIFLPVVLGAFVVIESGRAPALRVFRRAVGIALPGVLLIAGLASYNCHRFGWFTPTTLAGVNLTNVSGAFIEYAPDRFATIRDVYLKHRATRLANTGTHTGVTFDALPELLHTTGLSLPALSRELATMSVGLFLRYPMQYAAVAADSWAGFWAAPNYWRPERISSLVLRRVFLVIWPVEHWALRLTNVTFLLFAAGAVFSASLRERLGWDARYLAVAAIIMVASVLQALTEYGEAGRFGIPLQPLVVLLVVTALARATSRSSSA
jgi:hypothetical protein